jgi:hypothetical protein
VDGFVIFANVGGDWSYSTGCRGRWRPRLPPMRSTSGRRCGGLRLIKVADLEFLFCKDGDLP